ncbi:MAG TPA: polyprenyl diphosphate synthase [Candidatus Paceibacterota bacterium]|nr:polyprenyl diphosphate synthase [Candidatus Paceibacterota bacterium]
MEPQKGPKTVAIFMDGNRRWAKARALPPSAGHIAGRDVFMRFFDFYTEVRERWGTENYIFYAFSTENWKRPPEEVDALMGIFERALAEFDRQLPKVHAAGIRIRFIGQRERFSPRLQELMNNIERLTADNPNGTVALAVSYGGHADIIDSVNEALAQGKTKLTEEDVTAHLSTRDLPELDLIIRPGGERRLSNFLIWQAAYSELAFTETLWPDFTLYELERIFADYAARERRRGK